MANREWILFLQYLIMSMDGLYTGLMMELAFAGRKKPVKSVFLRILLFWLLSMLVYLPTFLVRDSSGAGLTLLINAAGTIGLIYFCYGRKLSAALFWYLMYLVSGIFACVIVLFLTSDDRITNFAWTGFLDPLYFFAGNALSLFTRPALVWIVRQSKKKSGTPADRLWMPCVIGIPILILSLLLIRLGNHGLSEAFWSVFLVLIIFFLMIVLIFIAFRYRMEKELEGRKRLIAFQDLYYETLQKRDLETEKLRHDYKNILLTVESLIESGRLDQAREILGNILEEVGESPQGQQEQIKADTPKTDLPDSSGPERFSL